MSTKGRTFQPQPLTQDEVRALLAGCSRRAPTGIRNRALITVLWRAGLRISEALDLRPSDVDPDRHLVVVANGKGGKYRAVGIDDEALAYVDRWLDARKALGLNGRQPLFCTLSGDRLWHTYVRGMLRRSALKAGIEKRVHPHGLRHTLARELVDEGRPLQEISRQLGHASLDGTAHYLRRIAPADLAAAAQARPRWTRSLPAARGQARQGPTGSTLSPASESNTGRRSPSTAQPEIERRPPRRTAALIAEGETSDCE